ncbi:type II toxin-antitoxin system Phd/YefM family antitoxin [Actinosynnema mirum]|uniref:Antitoxin n=1 Tax=Actinosynnema mirum (strain ATCC 29888 / DSM 43827 / JCM 3225 / NBRC 14064 / NCIMB 13271 / NRRL B-12336 / IMRU 3971 / 101) TaxID=446462 RepID=C6WCX1_ACTMD|nr:type II toxin-antitoxin system Phd/YefM family antitoxin [Actinosynnema mirum]ACU35738.1 prevent-host-death family protein [Actinosynnema mirum DSM 43827]
MKVVDLREYRAKCAEVLDSVIADREGVVVTRPGRDPVVLVALDDYRSLQEVVNRFPRQESARQRARAEHRAPRPDEPRR